MKQRLRYELLTVALHRLSYHVYLKPMAEASTCKSAMVVPSLITGACANATVVPFTLIDTGLPCANADEAAKMLKLNTDENILKIFLM